MISAIGLDYLGVYGSVGGTTCADLLCYRPQILVRGLTAIDSDVILYMVFFGGALRAKARGCRMPMRLGGTRRCSYDSRKWCFGP